MSASEGVSTAESADRGRRLEALIPGAAAAWSVAALELAAAMVDEASERAVRGGMTGSPTGLVAAFIEASNDDVATPRVRAAAESELDAWVSPAREQGQ